MNEIACVWWPNHFWHDLHAIELAYLLQNACLLLLIASGGHNLAIVVALVFSLRHCWNMLTRWPNPVVLFRVDLCLVSIVCKCFLFHVRHSMWNRKKLENRYLAHCDSLFKTSKKKKMLLTLQINVLTMATGEKWNCTTGTSKMPIWFFPHFSLIF